jgi:hypothetical protein
MVVPVGASDQLPVSALRFVDGNGKILHAAVPKRQRSDSYWSNKKAMRQKSIDKSTWRNKHIIKRLRAANAAAAP